MSNKQDKKHGNCYVTCEALYHLLGGKQAGLKPMVMKHEGTTHWFLLMCSDWSSDIIIDPTVSQFKTQPNYSKAKGCGFLTKQPSKKAKELMQKMIYK